MPVLRISIDESVWPTVAGVLMAAHGEPPDDMNAQAWIEQVAAGIFAGHIQALTEPPPEPAREPLARQMRTRRAQLRPRRSTSLI